MIIVEFSLDHPIMRDALRGVPGTTVEWERSDATGDDRVRVLIWADGDDLDAFEAALAEDPTVASPRRVATVGGRRLYQTELVGEGLETSVYPMLVDEGGIIRTLVATHEGWKFRVAFPDHDSFVRFRDHCSEHDIDFRLHGIFEERSDDGDRPYDLTMAQRETLVAAVEYGYLDVPRTRSLADLAAELCVSTSAASERFRRGARTLIRNALVED